jgi:membrane-bound serine protease (ClpP class)
MKIALLNMKEKHIFQEKMRLFHYFIILILIVLSLSLPTYSAERPTVFWVPLKDIPDFGAVEWGLASFAKRSLLEAEKQGAEIVVFEIDTFGGRVDAMLFIKDLIMQAPMKTVAFINSKAWSAGVFLALSCQKIIMVPDGSIGAAEPRTGQETAETPPDPKTVSAIRGQIEALAEARNRDPQLFAAMVDRNVEIACFIIQVLNSIF